jgi:hypothetical protein
MNKWRKKLNNVSSQSARTVLEIRDKARQSLGPDGIDLEKRARNSGKKINHGWRSIIKKAKGLAKIPEHEDRIQQLEKDTGELASDILDLKKWLEDVDNRTKLLEHYQDFDLDQIRCGECGKPMRVKRNRESGSFFLSCTSWPKEKHATRPITGPDLEVLGREYSKS